MKWWRPCELQPEIDCGDRVLGIVREREFVEKPPRCRLVILEATEGGWRDIEDQGRSLFDCELWANEDDVVQIADVISGFEVKD